MLSLTRKGSYWFNKNHIFYQVSFIGISMKGPEILEKILSRNKPFVQGERIGIGSPAK